MKLFFQLAQKLSCFPACSVLTGQAALGLLLGPSKVSWLGRDSQPPRRGPAPHHGRQLVADLCWERLCLSPWSQGHRTLLTAFPGTAIAELLLDIAVKTGNDYTSRVPSAMVTEM